MTVFFPILLVASPVFLQIARDKKEYGNDAGLQISEIEPFLGLRQMTEHDSTYCQCLCPINPVNPFFHVAKIRISG